MKCGRAGCSAWSAKWHKRYTAHLKGEENIFFQIPCSGSCFQQLKQVNLPAVDALERYPGNPYFPRPAADAAQVWAMNEAGDWQELGWAWGPDWTVETGLPEGFRPVRVLLCPSAYNAYGPHHDYRGDRPLVNPAQYEGKKNFADAPDAPACTLVPEWHGVRFGISS